jgi:hypothetical protein
MKNHLAQEFSVRLKTALKEAGVKASASHVASEFNLRYWGHSISTHAARNWLMGVSVPKQDKLVVLANWLRITPEALLFGTHPACPVAENATEEPINLVDRALIAQYLQLMPEHRYAVRLIVEALLHLPHGQKSSA